MVMIIIIIIIDFLLIHKFFSCFFKLILLQ